MNGQAQDLDTFPEEIDESFTADSKNAPGLRVNGLRPTCCRWLIGFSMSILTLPGSGRG